MAEYNSPFRREGRGEGPHPRPERRFGEVINSKTLEDIFADCSDFQAREIVPGLAGDGKLFVCWIDGLVDGGGVSDEVLQPLTNLLRAGMAPSPERLMHGAVYSSSAKLRDDINDLIGDITHGCCAVLFDGERQAVTFEIRSQKQRSIGEPGMEKSIKGAKDSFVELLRTNTALVRQRICNPSLKLVSTVVGRKTETRVAILYVDGVADPAVLEELKRRLDAIDIDGLLATAYIEQYITDKPRSLFPQLIHTERPDRFSRQLLNGRVGLIVDGIPLGFLLPVSFAEFLRVPQDSTQHAAVSTMLSIIRWTALFLALALPAIYVAIAMYHQEMIPTKLLMSIIASKQDVPFSTALEVLGMLAAFELLQEAGLRLPDPIGDTVSIIGAIIVGQSAVEAKVISPIAVIVVAFAAISGLAMPSQDLSAALRVSRFALVIAAIAGGLFGVAALLCYIVWHLCTIDSFGTNYTAPLSSGGRHPISRTFLRAPKYENKFRDPELKTPDRRKQA